MRLRRFLGAPCIWIAVTGGQIAAGQPAPEQRISVLNLVHTARQIRFEVQNNYTSAITFWQLRLQARCPDGKLAEAGGWSSDALRTVAAGADGDLFAPLPIPPIAPGGRREFSFIRPLDVGSEAGDCDASEFKDLSVIFADGTGAGPAEVIKAHMAERHIQSETLKGWISPLRGIVNAGDPVAELRLIRARLDDEYEDCEGRPLRDDELVRCGVMNRELRGGVIDLINQMRRTNGQSESAHERLERMAGFWERFQSLLAQ
ncbi:MAG: hypothetical protein LAQ30_17320 [Acidobacteriia bacterium]|nr:hypothetical protein [Terriglobia bacterium]